ncbi:MAG: ATP-binding protein [Ignavibacteria bacterium]|nr:ATP-binding protein [Ignavibacteria bacterium]
MYQVKSILIILAFSFTVSLPLFAGQGNDGDDRVEKLDKAQKILLSMPQIMLRSPQTAVTEAEQGLMLAKSLHDTPSTISFDYYLSLAHCILHNYYISYNYIIAACGLLQQGAVSEQAANVYNLRGRNEIILGKSDQATQSLLKAVSIGEKLNNKIVLAEAYNYIGILNYIMRNDEKAQTFIEKAYQLSLETQDPASLALSSEHKAILSMKEKKYTQAFQWNKSAIKTRYEMGDLPGLSEALETTAINLREMSHFQEAIDTLNVALKYRKKLHSELADASIYTNFGIIYFTLNHLQDAIENFKLAMQLRKVNGDIRGMSSTAKALARVYEKAADYKNALEYQKLFKTLSDSIYSEKATRAYHESLEKYSVETKQHEITRLEERSKLRNKLIIGLLLTIVISIIGIFIMLRYIRYRKATQEQLIADNEKIQIQNEQLNTLNEELNILNKHKDKLFSIIAHDLRSPFTGIFGYTDLLVREMDELSNEEIHEFTQSITGISKNLMELLDKLLLWAKVQTGNINFTPRAYSVTRQIHEIINFYQAIALAKKITLQFETTDEVLLYADKETVEIILRNLVTNAIKFTPQNGVISLSVKEQNQLAAISISDNGVGMNEEVINTLFTMEAHSTVGTGNERGTGLGLLLCKEMADFNKGEILVSSTPNNGSTFTVLLPLTSQMQEKVA